MSINFAILTDGLPRPVPIAGLAPAARRELEPGESAAVVAVERRGRLRSIGDVGWVERTSDGSVVLTLAN